MAFGALLNSGEGTTATGTSHTASFGFTAASNSLLLIGLAQATGSNVWSAEDSGWSRISDCENVGGAFSAVWYWRISTGQSSFSFDTSISGTAQFKVVEIEGPWSASALDVSAENEALIATPGTTSCSSGTTGTASVSNGFAVAFFASDSSNFWDAAKSWTNSYANLGTMYDPGATPGLWFGYKQLVSSAGTETTVSVTDTGDDVYGAVAVFLPGTAGGTAALTGQAASASAGTAAPKLTLALTGQSATASAGTVTTARTVAHTGQAVTASAGTAAPALSQAASGEQITAGAGTLALGISVPASGQAATASAGTVTYTPEGAVNVALSGAAVTASAGSLGNTRTVAQTGQSASASAGTAGPVLGQAASGTQITTSAGTLTLGIVVPASGQSATAAAGTLVYAAVGDVQVALAGEEVTASAGTLAVASDDVPLTDPLFARQAGATPRRLGTSAAGATARRVGAAAPGSTAAH